MKYFIFYPHIVSVIFLNTSSLQEIQFKITFDYRVTRITRGRTCIYRMYSVATRGCHRTRVNDWQFSFYTDQTVWSISCYTIRRFSGGFRMGGMRA